ncbi:hypothetical protein [Veillonella sp. VA139]|nr:hypothetical protein [Veillonella sp. VA139]
MAHEICHIAEGHFTSEQHASVIEALLHSNEVGFNEEEINFFYHYAE